MSHPRMSLQASCCASHRILASQQPQRTRIERAVQRRLLTRVRSPSPRASLSAARPPAAVGLVVPRRRALRVMSVMAMQRGAWSAVAACRALRAAGSVPRLPAAGLHAALRATCERRQQRSWLWASVAPAPLAVSPAARGCGFRSLHVTRCCTDGNLPATFVAPEKVNMADYPPPKRRLSKGAPSLRRAAFSANRALRRTAACSRPQLARTCARRRRHRAVCAQRRRGRAEREQGRVGHADAAPLPCAHAPCLAQ